MTGTIPLRHSPADQPDPGPRHELGQSFETQEFLLPRRSLTRVQTEEKKTRDRTAYLVALAATILSVAVCAHLAAAHEILGYQDAYSHLEISRRVLVSRTTGIAQLGTIWLPLPHMLQSLFAWNTTLYQTGLAGAFVSMASFVAASTLVYRTVVELCDDRRWPGVVGAAVFMTNANMLFQQSTPMDELPFYAFTLAAVYGLVRWATTRRAVHLLSAAIANMLAMLCRYEAWYLAIVLTLCVIVMARHMDHSWRDVRGLAAVWAAFGVTASALGWLIYNWMVTGSPINFLDGPDSSKAQMAQRHTDVEIGSWAKSLEAYAQAVGSNLGLAVVGLAVAGLAVFLAKERFSTRALPILALTSLLPFYAATLESGQEPIGIPPVNSDLLNLRFGLFALLPAALYIGYLVGRLPARALAPTAVISFALLLGISASAFDRHQVVLERESVMDNAAQSLQAQTGVFLQHHTTGPILVNLVGNERVAFPVLDRVVYEGTKDRQGNLWSRALADPRTVGAQVIVMRNSVLHGADQVYTALHSWPGLSAYRVVFHNTDYTVYSLRTA